MKQTIFTLLLMLVALTTAAQDKEKNKERLAENFFNAKVSELVYRLDMTEEQKEKFIPIYRRYNDEIKTVMGPRKPGFHHPRHKRHSVEGKCPEGMKSHQECDNQQECKQQKEHKKQLTDEEKIVLTKQKLEKQQQAQAIRLKYVDEFSTVLSAQQVSRFFEVEKDINKMMVKRKGHHAGPHHGLPNKGQHPQGKPEKRQK